MAASTGNCFICGKTAGKTAIKNHVLKEHNDGNEPCYLLKAEGMYDKDYWLLFTVPQEAPLAAVDKFLREIWCECCDHLSAFRLKNREMAMSRKWSALDVGDILLYEYDFGTTTEILITVVAEIARAKQREKVQLLARNAPPKEICDLCAAPAVYYDQEQNQIVCEACAEETGVEEMFLPLTNSPRSGECGYGGDLDIWVFDPNGPFPQPQKPKPKRGTRAPAE